MKYLPIFLAALAFSVPQRKQTFNGIITDDMCGNAGHASMRMGPTDAECTIACVGAHGAAYVLLVGKVVYMLSDQKTPEQFSGRRVRVVGTLDAKASVIRVDSMTASK